MATLSSLSSLPPGMRTSVIGVDGVRSTPSDAQLGNIDAAQIFDFNGADDIARALSVPPSQGHSAAQLESRFLSCLIT